MMKDRILEMIGNNSSECETLIEFYIENAKAEATAFCSLSEYSDELDNIIIQMVIEKYNRKGNEGISSSSFSGINESFINGYSSNIISALLSHRRMVLY